jgi:DNA anti-recombination protein RmuC
MQVEASSSAIIALTHSINNSLKMINSYGESLSSQLKTLGNTFRDEGYLIIQEHIYKTQTKVNEAVPELDIVMKRLIEYANRIKKSEGRIKTTSKL